MKTFTKNILAKTMALTVLMAASGAAFASTSYTTSPTIPVSVTIATKVIMYYDTSGLTISNIDPTTASGTVADSNTNNNFCVYSNASTTDAYTIAVNANSELTGASTATTLPYTVTFTQGSGTSPTTLTYYISNATAPTANTTIQFASTRNPKNCGTGNYTDTISGGRIGISVSSNDYTAALGDTYSGNLSVTVTPV